MHMLRQLSVIGGYLEFKLNDNTGRVASYV